MTMGQVPDPDNPSVHHGSTAAIEFGLALMQQTDDDAIRAIARGVGPELRAALWEEYTRAAVIFAGVRVELGETEL